MSDSAVKVLLRPKIVAFSLIEIVLALGIISFAIVGIMGLFPAAMKSALESQRETRAALIARQIFSDLKTFKGTNAFIAKTSSVLDPGLIVGLTSNYTVSVGYDGEGNPISGSDPALFEATVSVFANNPVPGISKVQASIRSALVPTNYPPYTFVTLMNQ